MWKILLALLLISPSAWATQWRSGTGEQTILGTSNAALIGYNSYNSIVQPLDNILSNYCNEYLQYASSSTMTVVAGTCVVSNSQGTIRLFMQDTGNTTITSGNIDTGSITANTTYYVYATAATNSATTSTYYISASNTAPSGQTYYYQIGSFKTDANNQFTGIINNNWNSYNQLAVSKSANVQYQALTDGTVVATGSCYGSNVASFGIETGSISGSMTEYSSCQSSSSTTQVNLEQVLPIRKGDYWEVVGTGSPTTYFFPSGK